jgi:phosphoribosyl 1,2-cyclic phosphodiesterase
VAQHLSNLIKVHFWGTSGSIPTSLPVAELEEKIIQALLRAQKTDLAGYEEAKEFVRNLPFAIRGTYYGNSSCVEVKIPGTECLLLDAGSGLRQAGLDIIRRPEFRESPKIIHLLLSHLHWDHIQGFPFFAPAYFPDVTIRIYGYHENLERSFQNQQQITNFPVALEAVPARLEFVTLSPGEGLRIGPVDIRVRLQAHPGGSYAYQFNAWGKRVVYATDAEYQKKELEQPEPVHKFFDKADLLIFDAQYTLLENMLDKMNWGHSNALTGIELATEAGVKKVAFTHHEPTYADSFKEEVLRRAMEYVRLYRKGNPLEIMLAYDGLELEL